MTDHDAASAAVPRHPLDLAAMAAYGAFAISSADRLGEMPPWDALPPEERADWRAVADAVQMCTGQQAAAAERERIRNRLLRCRDCGHIHGANELFEPITSDHDNRAPWIPSGPNALPFLDALLGDGPIP